MDAEKLILLSSAIRGIKEEIAKEALIDAQLRILAQRLHDAQIEAELQAMMALESAQKG